MKEMVSQGRYVDGFKSYVLSQRDLILALSSFALQRLPTSDEMSRMDCGVNGREPTSGVVRIMDPKPEGEDPEHPAPTHSCPQCGCGFVNKANQDDA